LGESQEAKHETFRIWFELLILYCSFIAVIAVLQFYWSKKKLDGGAHLHRNLLGLIGWVYPSLHFFCP
jgi:hypothetical protein